MTAYLFGILSLASFCLKIPVKCYIEPCMCVIKPAFVKGGGCSCSSCRICMYSICHVSASSSQLLYSVCVTPVRVTQTDEPAIGEQGYGNVECDCVVPSVFVDLALCGNTYSKIVVIKLLRIVTMKLLWDVP